jgi:hypothetical protein
MAAMIERARKRLSKRAKKGFRGWPLATVALYGPDDSTAIKLTVGIVPTEDAEASDLRRWFSKGQAGSRSDPDSQNASLSGQQRQAGRFRAQRTLVGSGLGGAHLMAYGLDERPIGA